MGDDSMFNYLWVTNESKFNAFLTVLSWILDTNGVPFSFYRARSRGASKRQKTE